MSSIMSIANGIALALQDMDAHVIFAPDFEIRSMRGEDCVVLPVGKTIELQTRKSNDHTWTVDVGLVRRCKDETLMPSLLETMESIGDRITGASIEGAVCVKTLWNPLFSIDEYRTNKVFIGVVEFTFREIKPCLA